VVRRSTLVVVFFFLIVGVIIGFNAFLQNRPPLTLTLAADPSAQRWASALVEAFNARGVTLSSGVRVQWRLDATVTDINVWQGRSGWTSDNHPNAWIAGAGWLASNVPSSLPFVRVEPSLAVSPLVWGGFESRVRLLTRDGTASLDWQAVQSAAAQERWSALGAPTDWGFVNVGISWPRSSAAGVNALASMLAAYTGSEALSGSTFADDNFRGWFAPLRQAMRGSERFGEPPPNVMAVRGAVVAAVSIAPEFEWLAQIANFTSQDRLVLAYPAVNVPLDFPLSLWQDSATTDDMRSAVRALADFILSEAGQAITLQAGLRPINRAPSASDQLFAQGQPYGILLTWQPGQTVRADRSVYEQLFRLMD
jgi:hypothetical protein